MDFANQRVKLKVKVKEGKKFDRYNFDSDMHFKIPLSLSVSSEIFFC